MGYAGMSRFSYITLISVLNFDRDFDFKNSIKSIYERRFFEFRLRRDCANIVR